MCLYVCCENVYVFASVYVLLQQRDVSMYM